MKRPWAWPRNRLMLWGAFLGLMLYWFAGALIEGIEREDRARIIESLLVVGLVLFAWVHTIIREPSDK